MEKFNLDNLESLKSSVLDDAVAALREISSINSITVKKKLLTYDLGDNPILLIPLADPHIGSKQCNIKKLAETIQLIKDTPNCYTILLGDNMEVATKESVGLSIFDEDLHLEDQIAFFAKLMKPLVAEGKVLASVTGNHEMRTSYFAKFNPTEYISKELKIPYVGYSGMISVKVGDQIYDIAFHHGSSSSTSPSGRINAMKKQAQILEADLYLSGHLHVKMDDSDIIYYADRESGEIKPRKRHYAICGSFLEYWDGYGEMKEYPPNETGAIAIKLNNNKKEIIINR